MKYRNATITWQLALVLLLASFVSRASADGQGKGAAIAMGGGNGTPEIYAKWKSLGGGKNAHVVLIPTANNPGDDIAPVVNGLKQVFGFRTCRCLTHGTAQKRTQLSSSHH